MRRSHFIKAIYESNPACEAQKHHSTLNQNHVGNETVFICIAENFLSFLVSMLLLVVFCPPKLWQQRRVKFFFPAARLDVESSATPCENLHQGGECCTNVRNIKIASLQLDFFSFFSFLCYDFFFFFLPCDPPSEASDLLPGPPAAAPDTSLEFTGETDEKRVGRKSQRKS